MEELRCELDGVEPCSSGSLARSGGGAHNCALLLIGATVTFSSDVKEDDPAHYRPGSLSGNMQGQYRGMKKLHTEIEIAASADCVWQILTDFDHYPDWNPFIRNIIGKPEPETKLKVLIQPPGARGMTFRPVVLKAQAGKELRWLGRLLVPGLFDGEHAFIINPIGESRVLFIQQERFSGLLVPMLWRNLDTNTRRGFDEMNAALKKLAEQTR